MKTSHIAWAAWLSTCLALSAMAQPTQGMPAAQGMGQGMGPVGKMGFDRSNTWGWKWMTPEERSTHSAQMHSAKTLQECHAIQDLHHQAMQLRATEKAVKLPAVRANSCERMKAKGFFK